jgi:predicted transcriptional regulator
MVLLAFANADPPVVLEEIAATASISLEQAWYAVLELIELRLLTTAGMSAYTLTEKGREAARGLA